MNFSETFSVCQHKIKLNEKMQGYKVGFHAIVQFGVFKKIIGKNKF